MWVTAPSSIGSLCNSPSRSQGDSKLHGDSPHVFFSNNSPFSAAVVVHERYLQHIRWHKTNKFASAVLVGNGPEGRDGPSWLVVSAYLPQSGRGNVLYHKAIHDVTTLIQPVPSTLGRYVVFVGCDANTELAQHASHWC